MLLLLAPFQLGALADPPHRLGRAGGERMWGRRVSEADRVRHRPPLSAPLSRIGREDGGGGGAEERLVSRERLVELRRDCFLDSR